LKPLAGVQLAIGGVAAFTDAEGSFILRDLPAGDLMLRVVPARILPVGLEAPSGTVKLSREPVQLDNVTIVISNPELLEYLQAPLASR
jgi:hypothetical protein